MMVLMMFCLCQGENLGLYSDDYGDQFFFHRPYLRMGYFLRTGCSYVVR